jgi:hypothetical protein
MEEKMTESIVALVRPERPTIALDTEPTPLEIQRWEDDGGAVLPDARWPTRARCHCGADHRQRAAA